MGALEDLLAGGEEPAAPFPPPPDRLLIRLPGGGEVVCPVPLPGGATPVEWLALMSEVVNLDPGAEWCLAGADAAAHPSDTPGQLTEWSSVPSAPSR